MRARDEHALAVLFRQEWGRFVATLTRFFGMGDLALAEDVAQETLVVALQAWSRGLPPNPRAWLFHVAKNRARDMVRRRRVRPGVDDTLDPDDLTVDTTTDEDVDADVLRMMFSCLSRIPCKTKRVPSDVAVPMIANEMSAEGGPTAIIRSPAAGEPHVRAASASVRCAWRSPVFRPRRGVTRGCPPCTG